MAKFLSNCATLTAFSVVCLTVKDIPCILFIGEPEIPESLLRKKEAMKKKEV